MIVIVFSGCIRQNRYVCPNGVTVSDPNLCFTTTTIMTTSTINVNASNANIALLDIYCTQSNIYYIIKNEGDIQVSSLNFMVDNIQKTVNCYPILPIKPDQTISCIQPSSLGSHGVRITGPSNDVISTVECKAIDTTIALLNAYCNSTSNTINSSIKNKGTTIISFLNIRFYVDGRVVSPNIDCRTPNSLNTGNSINCYLNTTAGFHEFRIVGPSNIVSQNITC